MVATKIKSNALAESPEASRAARPALIAREVVSSVVAILRSLIPEL